MSDEHTEWLMKQKEILHRRRQGKVRILGAGGVRALTHSPADIVRIDFALKRIEDRQYGLCCNCGTSIGKKRLASIPETPHCSDCSRAIEAQKLKRTN